MAEQRYRIYPMQADEFIIALKNSPSIRSRISISQVDIGDRYRQITTLIMDGNRVLKIQISGDYVGHLDGHRVYDVGVALSPEGFDISDDMQRDIGIAIGRTMGMRKLEVLARR